MEANRREMYRKSRDLIRVYNPLERSFRFMYDGFWHSVPANGTKDIERYLARHYFIKISEVIIGNEIIKRGEAMLKERSDKGFQPFLDKYEENKAIWDKTPKLNDPDLLRKIADLVILGLVEEYGMDVEDERSRENEKGYDPRPLADQVLDSVEKKIVDDEVPQAPIKAKLPM